MVQAAVLLKLIPSWQGRQEALFSLHTSLMTHSCLPYLASIVHSSRGSVPSTSNPNPSESRPPSLQHNSVVLTSMAPEHSEKARDAWHVRLRTLEQVGTCMGWQRSGLCWWPIEGGPVKVVLDTSNSDELSQLSSICRFAFTAAFARHGSREVIRAAYFGTGDTVVRVPDAAKRLMKGVVEVRTD